MTEQPKTDSPAVDRNDAPGRPKRRRWLRRLGILLLVLVALVAAAPYIASTGPVVGYATGLVNDSIHGRLAVGEVSLGWFGPCRISGVALTDRQGREVVRVGDVTVAAGLWKLATTGGDFERLDVGSPAVVLYRTPEGGFSLMDAVSPRQPAEEAPGEPPAVKGRIVVTGGSARIVETDGRKLDVPELTGDFTLDSLNAITGTAAVALAGGGRIGVNVSVQDLLAAGDKAAGMKVAVGLKTDPPVDLAPLGRFAVKDMRLAGKLGLTADVQLAGKTISATWGVDVAGLSSAGEGKPTIQPVSLSLKGTASVGERSAQGNVTLGGDCGEVRLTGRYDHGAKAPKITAKQVLDAALSGGKLTLPSFELDANGQVDLARLARAVPELAKIRKDVTVESGTLAIDGVAVRGGEKPQARGAVHLRNVKAKQAEKQIAWEPITLSLDAQLVPGQGFQVRGTGLKADFATLDANGTPKDLRAVYSADLAKLRQRLGEIFELGDLALGGTASGSLRLNVQDAQNAGYAISLKLNDLQYSRAGQKVSATAGSLAGSGTLERKDPNAAPVVTSSGGLTVQGLLVNGVRPGEKPIEAKWTNVRFALGGEELSAQEASLSGAPVTAVVKDLAAAFGKELRLAGAVDIAADLARCMDLAAQFGDGNRPAAVAGRLSWSGKATQDASGIAIVGSGSVKDLVVGSGQTAKALAPVEFSESARIDTKQETVQLDTIRLASQPLSLTAKGTVSRFRSGSPEVAVSGQYGGDLGLVAEVVRALAPPPEQPAGGKPEARPAKLAGAFRGNVTLGRGAADGALTSAGDVEITGLAIDGNSLGKQPVAATWAGVRFAPGPGELTVTGVTVTGEPASATVKDLAARFGKPLRLNGTVDVSADLARCMALAAAFGGGKPAEVAGRLTWSGKAAPAPDGIAVTGDGGVKGLVVGSGDKAVRIDPMTFAQSVRIATAEEAVHLDKFTVTSDLLAVTASGTVKRYLSEQDLNITGHYKGDWDRIVAVMHELSPNSTDIALSGPLESDFTLTGPASRPKLTPVYREVNGQTGVGWATAKFAGFSLGQARLPISLAGGKVVVPVTAIDASGGTVRLGGTVDMGGKSPQFVLPPRTVVLENVPINREVGETLLSRFNPIFGKLLALEGRINLVTEGLDLPLGEEIKKRGTGKGRLDLSAMKVRPGGLMKALLELGGLGESDMHGVEVSGVDFTIENGAIKYRDFTMTFDKTFPVTFSGAVRFDDGLDMAVGVPIRAPLLEKLGVGGKALTYAKYLENVRIDLPVVGTRLEPKLDLAKVNIEPLIQKATEAMLKDQGGKILEGILKPRDGQKQPGLPLPFPIPLPGPGPTTKPGPAPTTKPAPEKPEERILKSIFDLIPGAGGKKDGGK